MILTSVLQYWLIIGWWVLALFDWQIIFFQDNKYNDILCKLFHDNMSQKFEKGLRFWVSQVLAQFLHFSSHPSHTSPPHSGKHMFSVTDLLTCSLEYILYICIIFSYCQIIKSWSWQNCFHICIWVHITMRKGSSQKRKIRKIVRGAR